ncbi:bifunctional glycosyltransferase family 2 protein/CDP-glycerol:glycerophosphate glycerophosphotransferase [Methanobrevibacter sp.]|uniref:bifunctional glycosyltransferase/CDP-glycerol:glycerophosphate glycerophosphotransferase n=1 Tax=Methanobrevibacter sp. TaxID=66852 RepID=UPI002600E302|nr:bifunctional glycosyltransferase family 2 protein/CDP-glycerol:glycerophosphate glycerophosphotransferase [Methanobrevibacter sp.]MBQ2961920.1 bifunctional glycosyltransferase family 2 protein/CDP-glycerol:glycerophosphate glycerophosphotransferase [Methanobrevibacter sp.]
MVFLSIIIPFDKPNRYLKDCLDSIAEQELNDTEVILIINGIVEDISELLSSYNDKLNISIKEFENELGVAAARNEGLKLAKGRYVYFIDSDDYLYSNALEKLVDVAHETDADFINGERVNTAYIKDRFEEQKIIREQGQLLKKDASDLEYSIKLLVGTKTTRLEILSVLHSLIKRDIIGDLSFEEDKRYLTDYKFILTVFERSNSFIGVEDAIYAKRLRDDPINAPSLNQEEKENSFLMYANAYYHVLDHLSRLIEEAHLEGNQFNEEKYEILKARITRKLLRFYFKKFSREFQISEDEEWRNENFDVMSDISQDFNIENYSYLKKKEIKALQKGNKAQLLNYIKFRSHKKHIRRIFIEPWRFKALIYRKIINKKEIQPKKLLFESFYGKYYSDSPKHLYEYLYNNHRDDFEFVWVLNKGNVEIPGNPKTVKRFSLGYYRHIATAEYYIFNTRHPRRLVKKEGQNYICTWHGTPIKRLGFDQGNLYLDNPRSKHAYRKDSSEWDYMVSPNSFTTEIYRSAFAYEGEIIESGYPRNDILYNAGSEEVKKIRESLRIPDDKKIILYAPTWRDDDYYDTASVRFNLKLDLNRLKEEFQDEYIVLLRLHYFIADNIDLSGCEDFAFNVSDYEDIAELYLISDILLTDYSSVFFDFANLRRPILFYTYDLEKYENVLRGFYIDINTEVPGPLLKTNDEVIEAINNIESIEREYEEKYDEFYNRFCHMDDGKASERIYNRIWK